MIQVICKMSETQTWYEYFQTFDNFTLMHGITLQQAKKEIHLHGLTFRKREYKNDTLILIYE
ncbi:MAG: hypothetical protein ABI207_06130 [Crocinitomicaceae bacterium]